MADALKLTEIQRTSIDFERQRHLANWLIKSSPHMISSAAAAAKGIAECSDKTLTNSTATGTPTGQQPNAKHGSSSNTNSNVTANPMLSLMRNNGNTSAIGPTVSGKNSNALPQMSDATALGHLHIEGRKPKLRRFNSHDTSSNMFSVADFENARLARRNEIEMRQRLQQRMRITANRYNAIGCNDYGGVDVDYSTGDSKVSSKNDKPLPAELFLNRYPLPRVVRILYKAKFSNETLQSSSSNDSSTMPENADLHVKSAQTGCGVKDNNGSGAETRTSSSTSSSNTHISQSVASKANVKKKNPTTNEISTHSTGKQLSVAHPAMPNDELAQSEEQGGELFLLYRLLRRRIIFHGHNAKTALGHRKKGLLIPQEFSGYFSLLNEKSLPTATLYTSLIQLVRERVYKFISVDNMPAFTESQPSTNTTLNEGCLPIYNTSPPINNRPQYVKTTALGGQVFRLLAVFEDGKHYHNGIASSNGIMNVKTNISQGREKEKGRYAQLLNENRQILYVSLSTKGKFYEIEPGIPQILQKLGNSNNDSNKKVNPDCVHRITALVTPNKELPLTLRYISGPNGCNNNLPENISITRISTENVVIGCPITDIDVQSPLHLRKLHLTNQMSMMRSTLGFESEQRMLTNPNVQNILKFCQFNCDKFLKMVESEILSRPERSGSKSRVEGLKILRPLHLPKLLRREKTSISAHEKEDSIIFLTRSDLASLEEKEVTANATLDNSGRTSRITEKMKVFQTTKKRWFRKQGKQNATRLAEDRAGAIELDAQVKRMSMERYTDMSKLLQERFGDKSNCPNFRSTNSSQERESISDPSGNSDIGCSDTDTTTIATEQLQEFATCRKTRDGHLQKSMSLQDIELFSGNHGRKPDLLTAHVTNDTISESSTNQEDAENRVPIQHSFITEKLFHEFHVKTRQHSRSSSSLHQLLNFSAPQKLQIHDSKRSSAQIKRTGKSANDRKCNFNIGEPITGRRATGGLSILAIGSGGGQNDSLVSQLTPNSFLEDDLPYSSVRDSLILSSDESTNEYATGDICQALNLIDYTKENIYAEICNDVITLVDIPTTHTRDLLLEETHSTEISDDCGDYASLSFSPHSTSYFHQQQSPSEYGNNGENPSIAISAGGCNAVSRVQINRSSSPVSYHTVYLGDETLGEQHGERERILSTVHSHITTVELEGMNNSLGSDNVCEVIGDGHHDTESKAKTKAEQVGAATKGATISDWPDVDNIYNTLE